MGGVATRQCLLRPSDMGPFEQVWYFLEALYLEQRNIDCITTMFMDGGVPCLSGRTRYPWSTYAVFLTTPFQLTLITEPLLIWLCHKRTETYAAPYLPSMAQLFAFIAFTKFVKLVGHYRRHPRDLLLLPVSILFGYVHSLIKIYSFFTLSKATWGNRKDANIKL
ncbi:hypothetical protein I7I51_06071 [Histoplasma capsulatum]|uniref:Uncharacterized protein n=1 Tax=Ajellomyces capsulatus TaxID=5037 RepID=A0A8A1MH27_AJECA|nr:predicted protein [Histoplasma mississippiense (nom. inval.)]EDN05705.1 predicted protein [Histoplasma mississippiense (nom. inval.)]QSS65229.1 hypothetical protein I7I51_06071 [Histoplasma capsulatum]